MANRRRKKNLTCLLLIADLLGFPEFSVSLSTYSSSLLTDSWVPGLCPRNMAALLATALVCLPVKLVCVANRGVLTTNEERDLSFLLTGKERSGKFSGASTFLLLKGNIFALKSCKLWSGLQVIQHYNRLNRNIYWHVLRFIKPICVLL